MKFKFLLPFLFIVFLIGCSNNDNRNNSGIILSSAPDGSIESSDEKTLATNFPTKPAWGQYEITLGRVAQNADSPDGAAVPEGKKWIMATMTVRVLSHFATVVESDFSLQTNDGRIYEAYGSNFISLPAEKSESGDLYFLVDANVDSENTTLHYAEFASEDYSTMEWDLGE